MARKTGWIACTLAVMAAGCGANPPRDDTTAGTTAAGDGEDEPTENLVRTYLLADVSHVAPGQELSLGVRFDIAPTWHIYWINPGESGLPTEVEFEVPEGFTVGDVRFPGPTRFESPGAIVSYGYEDLTLVSVPVVAPDKLPAGKSLRFVARSSWLACREACIQGKAVNEIRIDIAGPGAPSAPAHDQLWTEQLARVPVGWETLAGATHRWTSEANQNVLELTIPGADQVEYFPAPAEQVAIAGQAAIPSDKGIALRVSFRSGGVALPAAVKGVLRVATGDRSRYVHIDIPMPKES